MSQTSFKWTFEDGSLSLRGTLEGADIWFRGEDVKKMLGVKSSSDLTSPGLPEDVKVVRRNNEEVFFVSEYLVMHLLYLNKSNPMALALITWLRAAVFMQARGKIGSINGQRTLNFTERNLIKHSANRLDFYLNHLERTGMADGVQKKVNTLTERANSFINAVGSALGIAVDSEGKLAF